MAGFRYKELHQFYDTLLNYKIGDKVAQNVLDLIFRNALLKISGEGRGIE